MFLELEKLLNKGKIDTKEEFELYWDFHDEAHYDFFHEKERILRIYLKEGVAECLAVYNPEFETSFEVLIPYMLSKECALIRFTDYDGAIFRSYKELKGNFARAQHIFGKKKIA